MYSIAKCVKFTLAVFSVVIDEVKMKKCPNCNKAVPFGARRCVYCRTPLDDENSTPNDQVVSERGFNATSRNFDNGSDFGLEDNPRKFNKTMIGLGPVSIHDAPKENTDSFAQRTIAGMRGISFDDALDTNKPGIYRMSGKSSISKETLNQAAPQFKKTLFQTSPIDSEVSPTPAADKHRAAAPAKQTAPEPAQEQKEDILAGLPGAAPMPSSLVDEEFVDLTSQVFGDDFASITQEAADDDDDGLDFDFPTAPAPVKAEPPKSESVKADDKSKNIIAAPEKALSDSVQSAPASSTSDSTASTDPAPASSSPAKKKKSKKKKDGPLDYVAIACAACGVLASVVVIVSLKGSGPVPIILLALAAALDGIFFAIRKKLSSMGRAILFFIAALVILGGLVMTKNALIIIPMICQVIGALCCFLKKA